MQTQPTRPAAQTAALTLTLTLALTALLFTGCSKDHHTPPPCHATRSGAVDTVPAGPRPCVLYNTGTSTPSHGHGDRTGSKAPKATTNNQHPARKARPAPKPPVRKAPPAPKPPAPAPRIR